MLKALGRQYNFSYRCSQITNNLFKSKDIWITMYWFFYWSSLWTFLASQCYLIVLQLVPVHSIFYLISILTTQTQLHEESFNNPFEVMYFSQPSASNEVTRSSQRHHDLLNLIFVRFIHIQITHHATLWTNLEGTRKGGTCIQRKMVVFKNELKRLFPNQLLHLKVSLPS